MKSLAKISLILIVIFGIGSCSKNPFLGDQDFISEDLSVHKSTPLIPELGVNCVEETAWVDGFAYNSNSRGNWATYLEFLGVKDCDVPIYAGRDQMLVGTACFFPNYGGKIGVLRIKFRFDACWSWQDVPEVVKIEGYNEPPTGNPAPGRFTSFKGNPDWENDGEYYFVDIEGAYYQYYGVHLDVQNCCN